MKLKTVLLAVTMGLTGLPLATMADTSATATSDQGVRAETKRIVSDTTLTTKVKAALIREKNLSAMDVNVETRNGIVQLSGFVDSADQQERAAQVAQKVEGVKEVKNDLRLAATATDAAATPTEGSAAKLGHETESALSDSTITAKVKAALVREKDLSAMDVNVETKEGVVQLSGFVDAKDQQDRAGKIAQSIEGVKDVKNDLRLKPGS